jgi:hypothetical protein
MLEHLVRLPIARLPDENTGYRFYFNQHDPALSKTQQANAYACSLIEVLKNAKQLVENPT